MMRRIVSVFLSLILEITMSIRYNSKANETETDSNESSELAKQNQRRTCKH